MESKLYIIVVIGPGDEIFSSMNSLNMKNISSGQIEMNWIFVNQDPNLNIEFVNKKLVANGVKAIWLNGDFTPPESIEHKFSGGSFFHARAIHKALAEIKNVASVNDNVLIVDPDFFIIKKGWDEICTELLKNHEYIGATSHPKHPGCFQDFPNPFFMGFSSNKISGLDFFPSQKGKLIPKKTEASYLKRKLREILVIIYRGVLLQFRSRIYKNKDTGWKNFENFRNSRIFMFSIGISNSDYFQVHHLNIKTLRKFESYLPFSWPLRLMPKNGNYQEINDDFFIQADKYYLDGSIFSFHARKSVYVGVDNQEKYKPLNDLIKSNLSNFN